MNRFHFRPWGFRGGECGRHGRATLNPGMPGERELGKIDVLRLNAGEVLRIITSAGGGFGDPLERPVEAIAADLLSGLVTPPRAASAYGVVFHAGCAIDPGATTRQRDTLRATRGAQPEFRLGPERDAYDRIWPPAMRARLAMLVMEQSRPIRQSLLRMVEASLTAAAEPVDEARLARAFAEARDELSGAARRRRLAERNAARQAVP
jgi:N-methylhydantoinase B